MPDLKTLPPWAQYLYLGSLLLQAAACVGILVECRRALRELHAIQKQQEKR